MRKTTSDMSDAVSALVQDASALLSATADVAGDRVGSARKRLENALAGAKGVAANIRDKSVAGAKAADVAVRENPYQAIAVSFAVGALVGLFLARRSSVPRD